MGFGALLARADRLARQQLGEAVTYTPSAGAPVTVQGIFDALFVLVGTDTGEAGIATSGPAVFLTLADLSSDPETDLTAQVTIRGVAYTAHTVRKDGQGGAVLLLHKV